MSYRVVLSSSFKICVKKLKKRFRHVQDDVKIAVLTILDMPNFGVVIKGGSGVRKLRVKNSDIQRGKSGGYRLLYFIENEPEPTIYLLLLYMKSDQEDITKHELKQLMKDVMEEKEV